ncbi:4-hydroxyphenylpyruvate dioxygenase [Klebsiella pneumoniae]|uniref:4-hydroxyphenylpyruvate dioxygenase n=1 Tax=Klebsiella pneumoniae TaxID=573 RepID=A0A377W4L7_KLEPN|nr:4-hydroxyphenylpyruvate dioxygenase [Klebsiella pneumoniae]
MRAPDSPCSAKTAIAALKIRAFRDCASSWATTVMATPFSWVTKNTHNDHNLATWYGANEPNDTYSRLTSAVDPRTLCCALSPPFRFPAPCLRSCTLLRRRGYQGVEIFENDSALLYGTPAEIRQLAADLGVKNHAFSNPFAILEGASRAQFAANMARARRKFALMRRAGLRDAAVVQQCTAGLLGG